MLVLAWVIFNIYHSLVTSTISQTLNLQISPINPTFDKKTIDAIKKRNNVEPIYDLSNSSVPKPTPTFVISPSSTPASGSSSFTLQNQSNQSSSQGGQIAQ